MKITAAVTSREIEQELFDPGKHPPQRLYLSITTECNYRCRQCHMWSSKEIENSLRTSEKVELIRQMHEFNASASVALIGGETMKKVDEFFALSGLCRELGMNCSANSNGSYISDQNLDRMLTQGPNDLTISLDSHIPAIHDYVRGVNGSFNHVHATLKKLATRKKELGIRNFRVHVTGIIFDRTVDSLKEYIEFIRPIGVDTVSLQILNRTFWNQNKNRDVFFEKHFFNEKERAKERIEEFYTEYRNDSFVRLDQTTVHWMMLYIDEPDFIAEPVCASHENNLYIRQDGDVTLCSSMMSLTGGSALGNVRKQSLRTMWNSSYAGEVRGIMSACRKSCGMLNCHKRRTAN